jgi:hypothetical protein
MVDIMTALATASQAIKLANDLRGIDKAIDAAEFKLKIADLTMALSDIKMALTDAKEELAAKQAEVDALRSQFARVSETVEVGGYKYDKDASGKPKGRAYCPVCEQTGVMIHIAQVLHTQQCPKCKSFHGNAKVFPD